jgi:hypothetical protein
MVNKDNIAIGIITSTILKDRYMACKNTWVKDFNNVFMFGGDREDENLIKIEGARDKYSSAFLKQQLGLKYMFEKNNNYDWYFICGCDTVLFKKNIIKALLNYDRDSDVILGGTYNHSCEINGIKFNLFSGGGGFFISNSLMGKIYNLIDNFNEHWNSLHMRGYFPAHIQYAHGDVAMAYMLKKNYNLDVTHLDGLFPNPPEFYMGDIPDYIERSTLKYLNEPLSYHYIKPDDMKRVYEKFNTN